MMRPEQMENDALHVCVNGANGDFRFSVPVAEVEAFRAAERELRGDYAAIAAQHPEWLRA